MNVNSQTSLPATQPNLGPVSALNRLSVQAKNVGSRTREALIRMRERMENLEQTLCQTVSENQELATQLRATRERLTLVQASHFLTKKALEEQQLSVADLEAQLAAYRRKAKSDQVEIEALKTQLFA
ncbi:hypothetical protein QWY82_15700 [Simiduia curdlanivorans]|uniref:Uncharacterized protein n=1 Tax=Simiduia curdlanivorans TaxID=1492769 RepID=A0ABV8V674_9GAMM|nr:hypothetical protein [Simiduia curdlanivorans]MDN3640240.1 hypothetical protein [Simiduia curdlanivorans]